MEEFVVILKKEEKENLSFLCSKSICLEDRILFENNSQILEGIVEKIDTVNQLVTTKTQKQPIDVELDKCFFPIIELYNQNNEFSHKQILLRDDLKFSTICPECEKNSRSISDCIVAENIYKKNNLKPYAFKK